MAPVPRKPRWTAPIAVYAGRYQLAQGIIVVRWDAPVRTDLARAPGAYHVMGGTWLRHADITTPFTPKTLRTWLWRHKAKPLDGQPVPVAPFAPRPLGGAVAAAPDA